MFNFIFLMIFFLLSLAIVMMFAMIQSGLYIANMFFFVFGKSVLWCFHWSSKAALQF